MASKKKITKIRLYRFQSHVDTTLHFDPVSTAIVGATDVGKSALTRALYWALYNKPARIGHSGTPDEFTTWGEQHCFVTVTFDDGVEITRGRRRGENYYNLQLADGKKMSFKGFGFTVPEAILDAHGMYPFIVDDKEMSLNITQQHDSIFMLDEGAGLRAKTVGKLSGAEKMDGALGVVNSWYRSSSASRKLFVEDMLTLEESIKAYDFVDDLDRVTRKIKDTLIKGESYISSRNKIENEFSKYLILLRQQDVVGEILRCAHALDSIDVALLSLNSLLTKLQFIRSTVDLFSSCTKELSNLSDVIECEQAVNEIEEKTKCLESLTSKFSTASSALFHYRFYTEEYNTLRILLDDESAINKIDSLIWRLSTATTRYLAIRDSYNDFFHLDICLVATNNDIASLQEALTSVLQEYEEIIGSAAVCPVCYSEITEDKLHGIMAREGRENRSAENLRGWSDLCQG